MGYRDTLNLPRTDFPMKGNLARREPEIQAFWKEIDLYHLILEKREEGPLFVLHDGPPYANGDIHVGTAYNKILKDIIVKYKTMRGYRSPYVPGWDCHGLPIEHEVEKREGRNKGDVGKVEFRRKCREYAMNFVKRQTEGFERLGVLGEFERPYLTLRPGYEATNIEVFAELYKKGLVYRGKKPIHWCTTCVTALAEAEIEYEDKESHSIYVRFLLEDEFPPVTQTGKPVSVLIWTTTPWTLPANVAIALHPRVEYAGVDTGEEVLVMARPLVDSVMSQLDIKEYRVTDVFAGSEMEGLKCAHPWFDRDSVIVLATYVTLEQGTGCVHIAPGHGQEDYLTGLEYKLPSPMPVDDYGYFTDEAGPFAGMNVHDANPKIIEDLVERGLLISSSTVTHQYPHCWRCKEPLVFRATPQWFIEMEGSLNGLGLRDAAISLIEEVGWIPDWSANRIGSMLETRPDWCISRQRAWGVPLPILYCKQCDRELITPESLESIRSMVEERGADSWFLTEPADFLHAGTRCDGCGSEEFVKETDIFDVWFESGVSNLAVLRGEWPELGWPADLYVEGSDQHRGWFQSSLLTSVGFKGEPPYKAVLTHGFTVDGTGRKMSKSLGNAIDPKDVYNRSGAEILRLWTAATDYGTDMPVSSEILDRTTESYRRIRNTVRFLLGNTSDFDPGCDAVPYEEMEEIDRWMLSRLQGLIVRMTELMERYSFHQAVQALHLFCTVDLSALYLDILKDRLYTFPARSRERRSAQTALYEILLALASLMSPILAHTSEEIWLVLPESARSERSVHLLPWPEVDGFRVSEELDRKWQNLLEIREMVYRGMEEARQEGVVGTGLEALVRIYAAGDSLTMLREMEASLPMIFIVSQVEVADMDTFAGDRRGDGEIEVVVERAVGEKCERCWNYSVSVGRNEETPEICDRCVSALEVINRE